MKIVYRAAFVVASLFLAVVWLGGKDPGHAKPLAASAAREVAEAPKVRGGTDAKAQAGRLALIEGFRRRGIIYKIEAAGDYPHLYVGPAFYAASIDDKQAVAGLVLAYYVVEGKRDMLILQDGRSGQRIGTMSPLLGLELK
jgi:hypothetical protein